MVSAICIILGYRLLNKGMELSKNTDSISKQGQGTFSHPRQESTVLAEIGDFKLFIKNVASGALFAIFGAIILINIVWKGNPELFINNLKSTSNIEDYKSGIPQPLELKMKGDGITGFKSSMIKANDFYKKGDFDKAISILEETLDELANPMNELALLYLEQNNIEDAGALSFLATNLRPNNDKYLYTYAEIAYKRGNLSEAVESLKKAYAINPIYKYEQKIENYSK